MKSSLPEGSKKSVMLVLGGARSGKSRYALQAAAQAESVVFIATATVSDAEMSAKIERHRKERPSSWITVEEPVKVADAITSHDGEDRSLVIDCLTLFSANLLDAYGGDAGLIEDQVSRFCSVIREASGSVVLVSNEVGSGVVPEYPSGIRFRDLLGEMNQRIAAISDSVVLMVAGLPLFMKGDGKLLVNR